jgi:ATP-binding cassette subfamily F protein 3
MSLLVLENIVKEYRNQTVLDGVSLRVERGERLALIGPNGAGKTTLLRIAMGLEKSDGGEVITARNIKVGYLTQDLKDVESHESGGETALHYEKVYRLERKIRDLERQMGCIEEDCSSELYKGLMDEYSRAVSRYEALDGYNVETRIKKILLGLGLREETLDTPVGSMSGGEKMRVAVARILLEEPDLLILDEPTNHLDLKASEWFEGFLKKFEGGVIFVSHDRYFLDRVATRIAELENGSICTRSGNYSSYMEHKKQLSEYAQREQKKLGWTIRNAKETALGLKSRRNISAWKSREKEVERLKETKAGILEMKSREHLKAASGPKISFKKVKHVSKDIAWAEDLRKYFGDVVLLKGASFHIRGGERVGIIGPNGCGKTTLINLLLGKDRDYEGFIRLGEWVKYSYMGQEVLFENEDMTVLQLIMSRKEMMESDARSHLGRFQFYGDVVDKHISVLSGGERVRLYLACVMLEDTDCLILDEPTNHLDVPARDAVEQALREFKGTIIAVTHDRYYLTRCVGKILEIEDGKINTYEGNYDFYRQIKYGTDEEDTGAEVPVSREPKKQKTGEVKEIDRQRVRQDMEGRITGLESRIKEMEGAFDGNTPPEEYREYNRLLTEVDALYNEWSELAE